MPTRCMVFGCSNQAKKGSTIKLYKIPTVRQHESAHVQELTERRRLLWLKAVNRKDITAKTVKAHHHVCSEHFISGRPSYYFMETHPDWIPNRNLGYGTEKNISTTHARLRSRNRRKKDVGAASTLVQTTACAATDPEPEQLDMDLDVIAETGALHTSRKKRRKGKAVKPTPSPEILTHLHLEGSEESQDQLSLKEGLKSFEHVYSSLKAESLQKDHQDEHAHMGNNQLITPVMLIKTADMKNLQPNQLYSYTGRVGEQMSFENTNEDEIEFEIEVEVDDECSSTENEIEIHDMDRQETPNSTLDDYSQFQSHAPSSSNSSISSSTKSHSGINSEVLSELNDGSKETAFADTPASSVVNRSEEAIIQAFSAPLESKDKTQKSFSSDGLADQADTSLRFSCVVCCTICNDYPTLLDHMKEHEARNQFPFVCLFCGNHFKCAQDFSHHHFFVRCCPYACDLCHMKFHIRSQLLHHKDVVHNVYRPHLSSQESRLAILAKCYQKAERHKINSHPVLNCDVCNMEFVEKKKLWDHKNTAHKPCNLCGKFFASVQSLLDHKMVNHSSVYKCDGCNMEFLEEGNFTDHKKKCLTKTNGVYVCEICGRGFKEYGHMYKHLSQQHEELKTCMCEICGQGFVFQGQLDVHFKTHRNNVKKKKKGKSS